jgi:hypothetical protein
VNTHLVASYLAAERQHHEAARLMARAERVLDRLIEHGVNENRAWQLAGVHLCDVRSLHASQHMRRARELLKSSVRNESTVTRLKVWALLHAKQPRAANDSRDYLIDCLRARAHRP